MGNDMNSTVMAFGPGFSGDGGFWIIGADGKPHWVPPWDPQISSIVNIATSLAGTAAQLKDKTLSKQLLGVAEGVLAAQAKAIQEHVLNLTH